jgi:hypothetical protein
MAINDPAVVEIPRPDSIVIVLPSLDLLQMDESDRRRFLTPPLRRFPVVAGVGEVRLGAVEALKILPLPRRVVEIRFKLHILPAPLKIELGEFEIDVHREEVAVPLPLPLVRDLGESVQWIGKIAAQRLLEPVHVLGDALRVHREVLMVEPIELFTIDETIGVDVTGDQEKDHTREEASTRSRQKTSHALSIGAVSVRVHPTGHFSSSSARRTALSLSFGPRSQSRPSGRSESAQYCRKYLIRGGVSIHRHNVNGRPLGEGIHDAAIPGGHTLLHGILFEDVPGLSGRHPTSCLAPRGIDENEVLRERESAVQPFHPGGVDEGSLIRDGGEEIAIAHDDDSVVKTRPDAGPWSFEVLVTVRRKQKRQRPRLDVLRTVQEASDRPSGEKIGRFAGKLRGSPGCAEMVGETARLRCRSGSVKPFKNDKSRQHRHVPR